MLLSRSIYLVIWKQLSLLRQSNNWSTVLSLDSSTV